MGAGSAGWEAPGGPGDRGGRGLRGDTAVRGGLARRRGANCRQVAAGAGARSTRGPRRTRDQVGAAQRAGSGPGNTIRGAGSRIHLIQCVQCGADRAAPPHRRSTQRPPGRAATPLGAAALSLRIPLRPQPSAGRRPALRTTKFGSGLALRRRSGRHRRRRAAARAQPACCTRCSARPMTRRHGCTCCCAGAPVDAGPPVAAAAAEVPHQDLGTGSEAASR